MYNSRVWQSGFLVAVVEQKPKESVNRSQHTQSKQTCNRFQARENAPSRNSDMLRFVPDWLKQQDALL